MKKIVLNHKSYLNYDEILKYKNELGKINVKNFEIIIFPSVIYLSLFKNSKLNVGTQNFFSYNYGSYTGEINLESLRYMDINYTLISHSERKKYNFEDYILIKEKLFQSLKYNFKTILCVGEKKLTKKPFNYIKKELDYLLNGISKKTLNNLIIAYEPSFAIENEESQCINKVIIVTESIKDYFKKNYNINTEIIYGGSVNKENIREILNITDGVLIGKLSTNIKKIKELIK